MLRLIWDWSSKRSRLFLRFDRLPPERLQRLREQLLAAGFALNDAAADARLTDLRGMYEPFVNCAGRAISFRYAANCARTYYGRQLATQRLDETVPQFLNFPTISPTDTHFR